MLRFLMFLGIVGLLTGAFSALVAHRRIRSAGLGWWRYQAIPLAVGGVAGFLAVTLMYRVSPTVSVVGFPFPAAAFADGAIFDGSSTIPMLMADVTFFLLLPQSFLAVYLGRRAKDAA
jgi:uncharacterized BrkB/YihY/UPF0761 family membrane protein